MRTVTKSTFCPCLNIKQGMILDATFIYSNSVQTKDADSVELLLKQAEALSNAWTS
jgi:hypothetical protein